MKKVEDLVSSARAVHDRYAADRMPREIVREWVLGLSTYPSPYDGPVVDAREWFKSPRESMDPIELKIADLARLQAIYRP